MSEIPIVSRPRRDARIKLLLLAARALIAFLSLSLTWKLWFWANGPDHGIRQVDATDPRLTYPTPFLNVRPEVKYVGDQACAACHVEECQDYRHHPMGLALAPISEATPIERFAPAGLDHFVGSGLHYGIERPEHRVFHREWAGEPPGQPLTEIKDEVQFACGSGARTRSYLVNHDGYLFLSPITWYSQEGKWDLSPSYDTRNQHFNRPITPGCLFCHCTYADHVPDTVNRYREPIFQGYAIGCERCHGPAEKHLENPGKDPVTGIDYTIVNPKHLPFKLRDAVCEQCHLQGEQRIVCRGRSDFDYRPGLPLHLFLMDFVNGNERSADVKFVGAVEQMAASRCYLASRQPKKLGCTSCHNPHRQPKPEEKVAQYRRSCLECHSEKSCSLPEDERRAQSPEDSCIACHMPRTGTEVSHASATNHRVPRRPEAAAADGARRTTPGPAELVAFHRDVIDPQDEELSRNLGLALMEMRDRGLPDAVARSFAEKALPLLDRALQRDERDWPAWQAQGDALWSLGHHEKALAAFDTVLSEKPERESALQRAGNLALALNRPVAARGYLERAVRVSPWRWHYRYDLARACFRLGEWDRAASECRESLRLDPSNPSARSLLLQCDLCAGQKEKAQAEYETLRLLTPQERREELRLWFEDQQRRLPP
jgi:predicted CXXCH cytochrome family protein